LHTRFKRGQTGNPGGRRKKPLPAFLADALGEPVFVTIDGERRQITKREAIVHQLVNKSTTADLRATKMLFDMMKDAEQKAGVAAPPPELRWYTRADEEVVETLVERIRHQIPTEIAQKKRETAVSSGNNPAETSAQTETAPMTDDELVEQLHELKRRNQSPIPPIEMFDALLFLDPG
jgi:hypothetical protein